MKYYTITAAESRIVELEADLAKYQARRVRDVDEKAWLSKRVTDLETALKAVLAEFDNPGSEPDISRAYCIARTAIDSVPTSKSEQP